MPGYIIHLILIANVMTASFAFGADGPRIEFDRLRHDYGKILYGATVSAEFPFVNKGNKTLVIKSLHATCGCTKAVEGGREIPPGGSSKITSSFDTVGLKAGRKEKSIMVSTNDPDNPVIKLILLADVIRELTIDPPTLGKKIDAASQSVSFPVKILNASDQTYNVTGIKTMPGELSANLNPARVTVGPHKEVSFGIELKLEPDPNRSFYSGKLDLLTDHARESDTELKYLIQVERTN